MIRNIISAIVIFFIFLIFWVFLFDGIIAEQEYRKGMKSHKPWIIERGINQYDYMNQNK